MERESANIQRRMHQNRIDVDMCHLREREEHRGHCSTEKAIEERMDVRILIKKTRQNNESLLNDEQARLTRDSIHSCSGSL
jgi:hypothetical protein